MPKRQAQRIIDNRSANRNPTTISGITLTSPGTAYTAGDGLTLTGVVLAVGAGDGISVAADAVAVDSTVVRTTRTVTAGSGLTGGGALSSNLTLNVGAGTLITVGADTVGITTGANYQYIGTGSGTAAAWQNLSGLAGAGLTHSAGVLAVGAGSGITVNADDVALTTPGTLTAATSNTATGNHTHAITTGAASTLTVATSNATGSSASLARADHLHTITTSSNPGAAASILASTASGGLTLASLSVTGAATVGQDFTVGANVLYVNQAGTRVGINRAPDQQFDLDVAGAIRGQYLIGRHAIQLASAIGVWHYDGSAPYNLDYTGSNASHMGASGTENGSVIYRPGKFGKAAQLAEATTNLITNPSFEVNTTGWTIGSGAGLVTTGGKYGANYLWSGAFSFTTATVTNGQQYTVSFWHRGPYSINVDFGNGTLNSRSASAAVGSDGWGRYTETFTANGSAFRLFLYDYGYDAVQLEQKAYATPYCDGSLGGGHSWSGTAHASSSSRLNAEITYSGALLSAAAGTLMFWADTNGDPDARMSLNCGGITGIWFILDPGNNQEIYVGAQKFNLSNAIASGWNHWALSWSATANEVKLFQNGVQIGTTQTYSVPTLGATLAANGFYGLDELVILDYAADAKLIRAIYESDAPVFVESSVFHWRAPSRVPIWVDEFGLWARGVSGNEILGLYGGDPRNPTGGVTKSWGGVTLSENDVLIGRAAGGYVFWDDSAQVLAVQGTITATAGSIGGWAVDAAKLIKDTGAAETSAGLAPSDYPFYAGATYANRATAPFRVSPMGAMVATKGNIGGFSLSGFSLSGIGVTLDPQLGVIVSAADDFSTNRGLYFNAFDTLSDDYWDVAVLHTRFTPATAGVQLAVVQTTLGANLTPSGTRFYDYADSDAALTLGAHGAGITRTAAVTIVARHAYSTTRDASISLFSNHQIAPYRTIALSADLVSLLGCALKMQETTAPGTPESNAGILYLDDNGSGKTRLMVRFSSGGAIQLAIQP